MPRRNPSASTTAPPAVQSLLVSADVAGSMCGRSEASWWRDNAAQRIPAPIRLPDSEWDIAITDLTDAEAALMLASRDRVTELAEWDAPALNELLQQVTTTDGDITELLSRLAEEAGTKDVPTDGYATGTDDSECEYPLTPVPGEKYDYVLIFCDNESDFANLQTMLKVAPKKDYKSKAVAPGRVIRFREFRQVIEEIARNGTYGCDSLGGPGGPGAGGEGDPG